ncbi:MAG TPA: histidine kinase [Streptosporangiaceae bacterium]|nr:histidine kinase [Streptosporangiaceae bacterium]
MSTTPGDPPRVRPPLTARLRRSHWIVIDCLAAVLALLVLGGTSGLAYHRSVRSVPELVLLIILASLAAAPVAVRRIWPMVAFGAVLALYLALGLLSPISGVIIAFPTAYVLYTVAVTYRRQVSAAALIVALAVESLVAVLGKIAGSALIPLGLVLIVLWTFGSMARQRRLYASGLQQQAASQAVAEERLRIARELHDVVAHSMAVIAVQAGFGQYVIDSQPEQAREALGAIQGTSRDALDEMRRMLAVLRQPDAPAVDAVTDGSPGSPGSPGASAAEGSPAAPGAPLRPADGLADLRRLITRVGHAGVHVALQVIGQPVDVPASVDLSAFRIIQESLTNVVKHAATPDCTVRLEYREHELSLEILDEGDTTAPPGPGTGHGLIGMRERVLLCGGEFSAGPRPGHGFRVAATLPLAPGPAPAPVGSVGSVGSGGSGGGS